MSGFHMIAWNKLCRSKKERELGLCDFLTSNLALFGKWLWWLHVGGEDDSSLWRKVVIHKWYRSSFFFSKNNHVNRVGEIWKGVLEA